MVNNNEIKQNVISNIKDVVLNSGEVTMSEFVEIHKTYINEEGLSFDLTNEDNLTQMIFSLFVVENIDVQGGNDG